MKSRRNLPKNFDEQVDKFSEILAKFNRIHSLTSYKDFKAQVEDSVFPLDFLGEFSPSKAIDVGSGAGFPAIFLAMILNKCEWNLFEPSAKKSSFLSYVKVALCLDNIIVHNAKIESCEKFHADLITSRALMKTPELIKICTGFYNKQTKFLLYKGSNVYDELVEFKAEIYNNKNRNYVLMEGLC